MTQERDREYRPFIRQRGRLARQLIQQAGATPTTQVEVLAYDRKATAAMHEEARERFRATLATLSEDHPHHLVLEVLLDERPLLNNAAMRAGRAKHQVDWAQPRRANTGVTTGTGVQLRVEERAPVVLLKPI